MGEKDFCTIANAIVKKEIEDINTEITEKETEIYEYIDEKTDISKFIYGIVTLNPIHTDDFTIKTAKCLKVNKIVYIYVQIEFLREFSSRYFVVGNIDNTKVPYPKLLGLMGGTRAIGQVSSSTGEISVNDLIGSTYSVGDTLSITGNYIID